MLKHISYYKPNYEERCEKAIKAFEDANNHVGGNLVFLVGVIDGEGKPDPIDLTSFGGFEEEAEIHRFIDMTIANIEKQWEAGRLVDDDSIPNLTMNMGIGEYSAFVGGEIEFTSYTSWGEHILKELEDYKNLPPLGEAKWFKRYLFMLEEFLKKTAHTEAPMGRGMFSPLDLAMALTGERLYMDFYDDEEGVEALLDYCADAIIYFTEAVYAVVEKYLGHTKYGMMYLRDKINMSDDIATNISADMYGEFCAKPTQKVIDHFGLGFMHTHSCAPYLVKEICGKMNNTPYMWFVTDPNAVKAIEIVPQLTGDSNCTHMAIDAVNFEEFEKAYPDLIKGNYSVWLPAESVEEAQTLVAKYKKMVENYEK